MSGEFVVAIPARHAATRLPGKPLRLLAGEPLVLHVARRALAAGAREVWVAADDERIAQALAGVGVRVAMTSTQHASGTDRLAECARIAGWADDTVVVNLQGDEPFAPAAGIRAVAAALCESGADISTLASPIDDLQTLLDPNAVKLVRAGNGDALYFSRAPIPWPRDAFASSAVLPEGRSMEGSRPSGTEMDAARRPLRTGAGADDWKKDHDVLSSNTTMFLRHIGIYAYRAGFLRRFAAMPPGRLERIEALEQLRALEAGIRIAVAMTPEPFPPGVDTEDDLLRAVRHIAAIDSGRI